MSPLYNPPPASGPAGAVDISETEIDFGSDGVLSASFTIPAVGVTSSSQIIAMQSLEAATDRAQDENEMDALSLRTVAGTDEFTLFAEGLHGPVHGLFKVVFLIG